MDEEGQSRTIAYAWTEADAADARERGRGIGSRRIDRGAELCADSADSSSSQDRNRGTMERRADEAAS